MDMKEPEMNRTWLSGVGTTDGAYEDPWVMFCIPKLALLHRGGRGGDCTAMSVTALTVEAPSGAACYQGQFSSKEVIMKGQQQ